MNKLTKVYFVDNSGAKQGKLFHIYNKLHRDFLYAEALCTLRKVVPNNMRKLKKGDKLKCLLSGLRYKGLRKYDQAIYFKDKNRAILLKKSEAVPLATRVSAKINKEIRYKGFVRLSLVSRGIV